MSLGPSPRRGALCDLGVSLGDHEPFAEALRCVADTSSGRCRRPPRCPPISTRLGDLFGGGPLIERDRDRLERHPGADHPNHPI